MRLKVEKIKYLVARAVRSGKQEFITSCYIMEHVPANKEFSKVLVEKLYRNILFFQFAENNCILEVCQNNFYAILNMTT